MIEQFSELGDRWIEVVGWEPYYLVSMHGDIWSLPRPQPHRGRQSKNGPLAFAEDKDGYYEVCLHAGGKRKRRKVHQIVAESWHGPMPEWATLVRHDDGDNHNNYYLNLIYGTDAENQQDSVRHGTNYNSRKTHCSKGNHPLFGDNLWVEKNGRRHCRQCTRERQRGYR